MSYYDHYVDQSTTRVGRWMRQASCRRQQALIQAYLPRDRCSILEIGPGSGELARAFLDAGFTDYAAVEPNAKLREHLEGMGIRVKDYMIPLLDEEDRSYDLIAMFHVFEHLDGIKDLRTFMSESRRVLRTGGLLAIVSPDFVHFGRDFFNVDYTHSNVTTLRRTRQVLHDSGYQILRQTYLSGFISGPLATPLSHAFRIGLCFSSGDSHDSKLYKLKTSFLRSFLIIGRSR